METEEKQDISNSEQNVLKPEQDVSSREPDKGSAPKVSARDMLMSASIILVQFVQMIPYGAGINSAQAIAEDLGVSSVDASWLAASYPLTQGAFVVAGGRLGAIHGHKNIAMVAAAIWVIFTLISGFMKGLISLCVMRALSGIGGAFLVPNLLALLTIHFPPGKLRNITVALFGAMAPIGAAGGGAWPAIFVQLTPWKYLFFFLAILGFVIFTLFAFVVPSEGKPMDKGGSFDYVGAYLSIGGLILFNFVWNQAPLVGWGKSYEYALLIVSLLHIAAFLVWEAKVAKVPIIPFDIWTAPSFMPMICSALMTFMAVGIVIYYIATWNRTLKDYTVATNSAAYVPLAVGGAAAAIASGMLVRHIPAEYIMATGATASTVAAILIATQSAKQIYWAQTFPALLVLSCGPDFIFTAAQIIASSSVKREHQGVAGSLVGTLAMYGLSLGLGFAATVEHYTNDGGRDLIRGYRNALYLAIGFSGLSIILAVLFVRIPKNVKEGWDEDDQPEINK